MMKALVIAAALALASTAQAQVYKCIKDGRAVFTDVPCAAEQAPERVAPAAGSYDPAAGARARMQTEATAARIAEEDARRQRQAEAAAAGIRARKEAEEARCREIAAARDDARRWEKEFVHPDNIRREREKAEHYGDRLWWECNKL